MKPEDIIDKCEGPAIVAARNKVHQVTVERWVRFGIPEKYWQWFIGQGFTVDELYTANQELKKDESNDI